MHWFPSCSDGADLLSDVSTNQAPAAEQMPSVCERERKALPQPSALLFDQDACYCSLAFDYSGKLFFLQPHGNLNLRLLQVHHECRCSERAGLHAALITDWLALNYRRCAGLSARRRPVISEVYLHSTRMSIVFVFISVKQGCAIFRIKELAPFPFISVNL